MEPLKKVFTAKLRLLYPIDNANIILDTKLIFLFTIVYPLFFRYVPRYYKVRYRKIVNFSKVGFLISFTWNLNGY